LAALASLAKRYTALRASSVAEAEPLAAGPARVRSIDRWSVMKKKVAEVSEVPGMGGY
jgi:hypothetical protein